MGAIVKSAPKGKFSRRMELSATCRRTNVPPIAVETLPVSLVDNPARLAAHVKRIAENLDEFYQCGDRDERAKLIATLIMAAHLMISTGQKWEHYARLINHADVLQGIGKGIRDPMFEPKTPEANATPVSTHNFRATCVVAVEALQKLKPELSDRDAQKQFLKDLEERLPIPIDSAIEKRCFPRHKNTAADEVHRRANALKEWAKERTQALWTVKVRFRFEALKRQLEELGPNNPRSAYEAFLSYAVESAKMLSC